MKKLVRFLAVMGILACIAAAFLFLTIDVKIRRQIKARTHTMQPAIYFSGLKLQNGLPINTEILKQDLLQRGYRELSAFPKKAGEFFVEDTNFFINGRGFRTATGKSVKPVKIIFNSTNGNLSELSGRELRTVKLDPLVIAPLGSSSIKASKEKALEIIPAHMQKALIAIEDERFYEHFGIDFWGILRAASVNIKSGRIVQGGSTLTQQLAKNMLFSPERTFGRKIYEAIAAILLESRLSKDEILALYLNSVYLGQEGSVAIHGVAEASRTFFEKNIKDISMAESALLAGIIKAPSYYSPVRNPARAVKRKDTVLNKMLELGYLSKSELTRARILKIHISKKIHHKRRAPFFVTALRSELAQHFNLEAATTAGISVFTGLDSHLQSCAEKAVSQGLSRLEKRSPALSKLEVGLVGIEPFSGLVKAWCGGRNYRSNQFDHVQQARRQIGSTIKPFVYLTALDPNLNEYKVARADIILPDKPLKIRLYDGSFWEPQNFDHKFRGKVTLRYALEKSLNVPAVYVAQKTGISAVARTIEQVHLAPEVPRVPSLALGALDTSLLKLTSAYAALANGGIYITPRFFISAVDSYGDVILLSSIEEKRVADEDAVYVLNNILQGVIARGTGRSVRANGFHKPAAGKTGTSDDSRDAWFVGFSADLAVGVWVGFDDNSKTGLTGASGAAPIWTEFMKCAETFRKIKDFIPPRGVVFSKIDSKTGQLVTPACPAENIIREVYVDGTQPTGFCSLHGGISRTSKTYDTFDDSFSRPRHKKKSRRKGLWEILFGNQ